MVSNKIASIKKALRSAFKIKKADRCEDPRPLPPRPVPSPPHAATYAALPDGVSRSTVSTKHTGASPTNTASTTPTNPSLLFTSFDGAPSLPKSKNGFQPIEFNDASHYDFRFEFQREVDATLCAYGGPAASDFATVGSYKPEFQSPQESSAHYSSVVDLGFRKIYANCPRRSDIGYEVEHLHSAYFTGLHGSKADHKHTTAATHAVGHDELEEFPMRTNAQKTLPPPGLPPVSPATAARNLAGLKEEFPMRAKAQSTLAPPGFPPVSPFTAAHNLAGFQFPWNEPESPPSAAPLLATSAIDDELDTTYELFVVEPVPPGLFSKPSPAEQLPCITEAEFAALPNYSDIEDDSDYDEQYEKSSTPSYASIATYRSRIRKGVDVNGVFVPVLDPKLDRKYKKKSAVAKHKHRETNVVLTNENFDKMSPQKKYEASSGRRTLGIVHKDSLEILKKKVSEDSPNWALVEHKSDEWNFF